MPEFEILLVFGVIAFLLPALYLDWFRPSISFLLAISVLAVFGVLSPKDVLAGLANDSIAVIVLLLVLSEIIKKSTVVNLLFDRLFLPAKTAKGFIGRMMLVVAPASAFFNNTPLVAMMMPYIHHWSKKRKVSASKLMIPLSYAAILGGCATLVGTSTNLIVNGLAEDSGTVQLEIFDFAWAGVPMMIVGGLYLAFVSGRLLPDHQDAAKTFEDSSGNYFVEAVVKPGSQLIGQSITNAGLRALEGLFLVEIVREGRLITPVSPEEVLQENDNLIFTGNTEAIGDLTRPSLGLSLPKACEIYTRGNVNVVQVVVSHNSWLAGKSVKESDFRGKYDGGIVAIQRDGETLSGKIGDVVLRPGDSLLVLSGSDFFKRAEAGKDLYVIGRIMERSDVDFWKVALLVGGLLGAVVLSALKIVPLFTALLVLLGAVLLLNIVPISEIRKGVDFDLVVLLAMGLALGRAMINSGAATYIAAGLEGLSSQFGPVGLLAIIFVITNALASYITNVSAVAIIFPISVAIAQSMGYDIKPFVLVVAFGAAANFITPIGYQTNLMVYGPGGYSFRDYMKVGFPLTILYMVVCVGALSWAFGLL